MKTAVKKWLKEQSTEFYEAGIHALIQSWNIAIERTVTMLRSRDVVHRGPVSF